MLKITAFQGDIIDQDVDAVVNPANNAMRVGGGVDGASHRAGGSAILGDFTTRYPVGLATGDAGWTTAGDLPARWVVHTVGPNYRAGQRTVPYWNPATQALGGRPGRLVAGVAVHVTEVDTAS